MLNSPCRRLDGNQIFIFCAIMMAHNLSREIQMLEQPSSPRSFAKRTAVCAFQGLDTMRHHIIQRAGRLTRPQGKLTLTISENHSVRKVLVQFLEVLKKAA